MRDRGRWARGGSAAISGGMCGGLDMTTIEGRGRLIRAIKHRCLAALRCAGEATGHVGGHIAVNSQYRLVATFGMAK